MPNDSKVPLNSLDLKGEMIKQILFINICGGDKTFIIFESGKVLVMPVYRECPIQFGMMADLSKDFDEFLSGLNKEKEKIIDYVKNTIEKIEELKRWPGQLQTP